MNDILNLMEQQRKIFLEIERITEDMLVVEQAELFNQMDKRNNLFEKAQDLQRQIKQICETDKNISDACSVKGIREDYTEENRIIYDKAYSIRAITNRIIQNGEAVKQRVETEKEIILKKIQELNQNGLSVAEKYKKSIYTAGHIGRNRFGKRI